MGDGNEESSSNLDLDRGGDLGPLGGSGGSLELDGVVSGCCGEEAATKAKIDVRVKDRLDLDGEEYAMVLRLLCCSPRLHWSHR